MCQITINPSFPGTATATGASVTVSGTVAMTPGDPAPCAQVQVSILCTQSSEASSDNTTPDAQGNWTITIPVTCTCNDKIEVIVRCVSPVNVTCKAIASGLIDCSGGGTSTGTGDTGTSGTGTNHCRPVVQLFGFSIVLRCQLVLFVMSISWGTALGMFIFYNGLGPYSKNLIGPAVAAIWIIAASIALIGTLIYLLFCRQCLCWFWLLLWRALWLGGILAALFRKTQCGPNCKITSYIGVGLMILAIIALFVWQRRCKKTICDAAYEGILYTVAVFFPVAIPLMYAFYQCAGPLTALPTPWGGIVLGAAFTLFWVILLINVPNKCNPSFPPPEWDF